MAGLTSQTLLGKEGFFDCHWELIVLHCSKLYQSDMNQQPTTNYKKSRPAKRILLFRGTSRNRTRDTRIFSPVLYQLS